MMGQQLHWIVGSVRVLATFVALVGVLSFSTGLAQTALDPITPAMIEEMIEAVVSDITIDEDSQRSAIDLLNRAKDALVVRSRRTEQIADFQATARNLNSLLAEIESRHSELETETGGWGDDASVAELESGLSVLTAERQSLSEQLSALRAQSLGLSGREAVIADEVIAARNEVTQLSDAAEINEARPDEALEEARWLFAQAALMERQSAVTDLQIELETLPARQSLVAARLSLLESEIARNGQTIELLRSRLSESALGRAEMAIRKAEADLAELGSIDPTRLEFAEGNLRLAEEVRDGILRRTELERQIADSQREANALDQSAETVRLVLRAGRLSDETAILLKTVRTTLPDRTEINSVLFQTERKRGDIQLRMIVWLEELRALEDAHWAVSELQVNAPIGGEANRLSNLRRSQLELLVDGARLESELISEHELALAELNQKSEDLSKLVDRRLLWLRTSERMNLSWLEQFPRGVAWILSPSAWADAIRSLFAGAIANAGASSLFALVLLALMGLRHRLVDCLDHLAKKVGNVGRDSYWTTPSAMGVTVLLALPLPLAVSMAGWLLSNTGAATQDFTQGLAETFILLGPVLLVLFVFLEMCRPNGLFDKHFNWTQKARIRLQANLRWFTRLQAGAISLFGLTVFSSPPGIQYGVGVAAFVIGSIGLSALTFQFLRPRGGIVSELKTGPTTSLLLKLLVPIAVLEPLLVGVMPFFGYFDTATELQLKVLQSGGLVLGGSVLYGLATRIFMVGERRLALVRAKEKRARMEAARASRAEADASGETMGIAADDAIVDAEVVSTQVRSLLRMVAVVTVSLLLWVLWDPWLPALGIAGDVSLWTRMVTTDGTELREAVTLLDLLTALFFLAIGVFAVRNVGGLLEIGVFEPFDLDPGSRYAVVSITRYVMIAVAIVVSFSLLGANWSELQWIIAALGVGLGFGLQEIVANFVSGLVILFERPIRIGDVVTIGELRGTVRSIRIRSTTITDFDNRQVILPNKKIVTENVTNWTLEDDVTRLLLRVGVAYGSDIETVRALILDVVSRHPDVLDTPPPTVFFMAHGDSALLFEIRSFVSKPVKRLPTTHELNTQINKVLGDNGIHIPFPQTDVHVSMSKVSSSMETPGSATPTDFDADQDTTERGRQRRLTGG